MSNAIVYHSLELYDRRMTCAIEPPTSIEVCDHEYLIEGSLWIKKAYRPTQEKLGGIGVKSRRQSTAIKTMVVIVRVLWIKERKVTFKLLSLHESIFDPVTGKDYYHYKNHHSRIMCENEHDFLIHHTPVIIEQSKSTTSS